MKAKGVDDPQILTGQYIPFGEGLRTGGAKTLLAVNPLM
jgi:hypothetical protein